MHDTDTLKEISDEYYNGELSPEKALVFYLLENGAKLDVRDKIGNLPIQYAKDEVVKQMILSRLPSLEEIQSYRDEPSTPAIVSVEVRRNTSQAIELEDHGVSMLIPPEAIHQNDPCKITLTLLQNTPSVDIKDDESVVCYGIRCDPPNLIFHQPVKIRIPHFALVVNPDQVKPNIVSRVLYPGTDVTITSRKISSSSPHKPPYCRVYKRHLELYIGKCAEWWVLIPLKQQVTQHQLICTPYIPDKIERGQEFEVHLQMHADLPGMETDIRKEKKQQSYHKSHRSVPFSAESKSGDVTVTCHQEGKQVDSKVLSLKDVCGKMRHSILLSVAPTDDDVKFTVITMAITQAGRLGVSQSLAFIIRHTDGQEYLSPSEPLSFVGAVEEVLKSDLPDIDVLTVAQTMTIDQFYDLGVALGFTIQQLDVIEYRRFHDREQAIYDMLMTWRERQPSGQAAKETFLSLMESLDPPAEGIAISDIVPTGEIPDRTLLAFARQIRPKKFFEIGEKLGFNTSELQHIEHRILYNRENANIQMLSCWKASQTSGPKAKQTLKLVWESVQDASKAKKAKDEPSTPAIVSAEVVRNTSQDNELEDHGVSMLIPPEAVHQSDRCKVTLTPLQGPPSVDIQDDESVVSYGIRCGPPNMIFHKPVKIRIPHYALVMNPDQVEPNIVSRVLYPGTDVTITSRKRSSRSPQEPPYCRVYKRHLELYIGKCAEWWVFIPLERQVIQHRLICTPYIPDKIERGQEFKVHLQMHADLPGIETDIRKEKKQQSYHKSHRSVPLNVESKSGDVTVTCHQEGKQIESKVLSLKDICGKMRHSLLLSVTPTDEEFTGITITITQAGRPGVSRSIAFIVRHTDGQEYLSPSEPLSFVGDVEEVLKSDLPDIDVLTIAQTMTVDQFYDLGVALGFTIEQLDVIEYRRFRDREQAIYDMLLTWRERQPSGQAAKETFLSLMESLDSPAEGIAISDIGLTGEIPDKTLLAFAREIVPQKFYEIGGKLGFNTSELQHIEHRTLYNRENANIQMLSSWKASQTSRPKAKQTLKLVWDSVQDASKAKKTKDGRSATGKFGALGGKLSTKSHGFTLHIPPGALEKDEEISLIVLTDIPEGLTLKKDELLISHGFQCYPSGLRFKKPAKLIIPHCAFVTAPNNLKTILYSWDESGIPKRVPDSSNIICSVQERWLEVSVSHFSGGFIATIRDWLFLKGILLSCMSFLPRFMPPSRKPRLEVRLVKKPHGQGWKDVHVLDDPDFQPVKADDDEILFREGTLTVTCQLGEKSPISDGHAIQYSDMDMKRKVTKYFKLDLTEEMDETSVTLEVVETNGQTIIFNTRFQGIDKKTTEQNAPSPTIDEIQSDEQKVTDSNILKLARLLPPNLWSPLYCALSIDYSIAKGIRENSREMTEQYIDLLQIWKSTSTRTRGDLNAILKQAEAGGFVDKYLDSV